MLTKSPRAVISNVSILGIKLVFVYFNFDSLVDTSGKTLIQFILDDEVTPRKLISTDVLAVIFNVSICISASRTKQSHISLFLFLISNTFIFIFFTF